MSITTGQWTFTPGIRVEWLNMAYHDRDTDTRGTGSLNMVGGGLGAIYRFSDHWNVFGGVHRGFSPPGPRAAIRGGLEEETSLAWELGSRYSSPNGAFFAQGTLFSKDFDNLIAIDNAGGTGSGDAQNLGEADNKGLELELGFDPGVGNGWTFNMPSFVALTYSDAKLRSDSDSGAESIFSGARSGNRVPYLATGAVRIGSPPGQEAAIRQTAARGASRNASIIFSQSHLTSSRPMQIARPLQMFAAASRAVGGHFYVPKRLQVPVGPVLSH